MQVDKDPSTGTSYGHNCMAAAGISHLSRSGLLAFVSCILPSACLHGLHVIRMVSVFQCPECYFRSQRGMRSMCRASCGKRSLNASFKRHPPWKHTCEQYVGCYPDTESKVGPPAMHQAPVIQAFCKDQAKAVNPHTTLQKCQVY